MSGERDKNGNAGDPGDSDLPATAAALGPEDRADLLKALKDKLQSLSIDHEDMLKILPPKVKKRVEVLRDIQAEHNELEANFLEEKAALVAKYQKLYEPLYTKRYEIVNGVAEVDEEKSESVTNPEEEKVEDVKGVPGFWLTAMKNNEILSNEITERDEGALRYLKDIKWHPTNDPKGFDLEFYFDFNPYFKNSVLTKDYHLEENDEPVLEKVIGTDINWNRSKCLTQNLLKKRPRKGSKNANPIIKTENCDSFFNFFKLPEVPDDDEDIDDDTIEELQNLMDQDYEIALCNQIVPSISWFTGEAAKDDDYSIYDDDHVDEEEGNDQRNDVKDAEEAHNSDETA